MSEEEIFVEPEWELCHYDSITYMCDQTMHGKQWFQWRQILPTDDVDELL